MLAETGKRNEVKEGTGDESQVVFSVGNASITFIYSKFYFSSFDYTVLISNIIILMGVCVLCCAVQSSNR